MRGQSTWTYLPTIPPLSPPCYEEIVTLWKPLISLVSVSLDAATSNILGLWLPSGHSLPLHPHSLSMCSEWGSALAPEHQCSRSLRTHDQSNQNRLPAFCLSTWTWKDVKLAMLWPSSHQERLSQKRANTEAGETRVRDMSVRGPETLDFSVPWIISLSSWPTLHSVVCPMQKESELFQILFYRHPVSLKSTW